MGVQADSIEVGIESSASKAIAELDKFISKLNQVGSSIRSINGGGMTSLANGVKQLSGAMQGMNGIKTTDFNRLGKSLEKIGGANASGIYQMAGSLRAFSNATKSITGVSESAVQIGELAKNISRFGYKGATNAIDNMPKMAAALNSMMASLAKAPRVSNNLIQMTNALAALSKQGYGLKGTASALNGVNGSLRAYSSTASRATKNTFSLAAAFGKFYASCFLVIRGIKQIGKSITNSMDYIESYNYFNVITDKIGSEFGSAWKENGYNNAQEYAASFKDRLNNLTSQMTGFDIGEEGGLYLSDNLGLGLDPNAIMNFQAQISSITNAAKLTGETSINASKALTMLSADLSSLKNQDLQSVMENLQSGLVGQSEALYKYGFDITNATLQQYAFANGVSKTVSEMTQAEKMQLRLLAILDQSKVAWGDMANTIDGVANQYRILKQQISNLSRIIGNLFIPVLQAVLPYLNGIVIALQRFFTWIGNLMGIKWSNLMDGISSGYTDTGLEALNQDADNVTDSLEDANKAANKLKNTIHSYDELHIATDNSQDNASIGGSNGIDLSKQIADALADYEDVWNKAMERMENKAQEIADKISAYFKKIHDAWKKDADMSFVGEDLGNAINNLLSSIDWESVKEIGYKLGKSISTALSGFLRTVDWQLVGKSIAEAINTYVQFWIGAFENFDFVALGSAIANAINGFFENFDFKQLAKAINLFVQGIGKTLRTIMDETDWSKVIKGLFDFLSEIEIDTIALIIGGFSLRYLKGAVALTADILRGAVSKQLTAMAVKAFGSSSALATAGTGIAAGFAVAATIYVGFKFAEDADKWWKNIKEYGWDEGRRKTANENSANPYNSDSEFSKSRQNIDKWWEPIQNSEFSWKTLMEKINTSWNADVVPAFAQFSEGISSWWTNDVSPWFTAEKWGELWSGVKESFATKWGDIVAWWDSTAIGVWWNEHVTPYFEETDWTNLFSVIKSALGVVWGLVVEWWDNSALGVWWNEHVSPYFEEADWTDLFSVIKSALQAAWGLVVEWWESSTLGKWWAENVEPYFEDTDWKDLFSVIESALRAAWGLLVQWWESSALYKWYEKNVKPWFTNDKWNFEGIKKGLGMAFDAAVKAVKQIWNTFANWLNSKLKLTIPPIKVLGFTLFGGATLDLGKIPTFQTGGFPEDGLFMANHNELLGKFSNGKTAVANNEQIISGIEGGVERAMTNSLMNVVMATQGSNNSGDGAENHIHVHFGSEELGVAVYKALDDASVRGLIPGIV